MSPKVLISVAFYLADRGEPMAYRGLRQGARPARIAARSADEVILQQPIEVMVLPGTVDAQIPPRHAFAGEAAFLKDPRRGSVARNTLRFHAMLMQFYEERRQQHAQRRRHVALLGVGLADPVADGATLHDAATDIGQPYAKQG